MFLKRRGDLSYMYDIELNEISKDYIVFNKQSGFLQSVKQLFHREQSITPAINSITLNVEHGECLGIIGANGAGKTTLIKMMTGIISPTSGSIRVLGYIPFELKDDFKKRIAFVSGQRSQLFFDLTAMDSFLLLREIYDVNKDRFDQSIRELSEMLEVTSLLDRPVRNLSLGERMKMEIISALIHDPAILFLDEPTIGLDCISQSKFRKYLKKINNDRMITIILTSHDFADILDVCERGIVLNHGNKIFDEDIEKLLKRFNTKKVITIYLERPKRKIPLPKFCDVIAENEDKVSFAISPDKVGNVYDLLFSQYPSADILIEDEDVASIIERVYKHGNVSNNS